MTTSSNPADKIVPCERQEQDLRLGQRRLFSKILRFEGLVMSFALRSVGDQRRALGGFVDMIRVLRASTLWIGHVRMLARRSQDIEDSRSR